ncbi:MAG: polymorphic toxin-type HINT domain-containing protein [Candidatus Thiodiazotropha endolucinida]
MVDDNQPPVITAGGMPNAEVSIPYEYQINASDPDGDALTYSLAIAPEGMTVNENTGMISWVPTDRYSNTNAWVRYVVTDAQGLTVEQRQLVNIAAFSNRAPEFIPAYRPTYAKVGREYTHQPQAIDREGDYPITYRLSSYSPEPTIDSENGTISWTPTTEGSFWITVAATDSLGNFASNRQITWYVEVVPATTPLGVDLQLTPAEPIDLGESVTLNVVPINSATTPQVSLTVDGAPANLDALLASTITPDRVGRIPVTVTVSDGYETVERTAYVVVRDPNDTTPPVVELVSPATATTVTSLTDIIGTAQDDNLVEVRLAYKRADQSDAEYIDLYRGNRSFDNEIIANLDPSLLVNGIYHILLQATDSNNNVMGRRASVFVDGDRKVGQFSFTVEDLVVSLAGIPITVSRTYDSRRRTEALDFGYGWTVDYQNVRLEESQEPTQGWYQTLSQNETFWVNPGYVNTNAICIYPVSEKTVSVTLANKEVEKFRVVARPSNGLEGAVSDPNCYMSTDRTYDLFFEAIDGTQSTLETADAQSLYLSDLDNGYLATAGDGQAQPVTRYTLTTRTGYVYQLNQGFGVERITDPNGHTLTYSDSGISHSDGKQVTFTRDAQGRISAITDPMGHGFEYTYNTNGDLVRFTDPTTAATQYTYNNQHGLIDIIDPLDRSVLRNHYDDDGRLYAQEDGAGNWKYFDHNLTANSTVVTDLDGRVTLYNYDDQGNVLSETQVIADNSYSGDIITRYTYDANGNQESKAIGESTWITRYDEHNDLQTAIDPEGGAILYENYTPYGQAGRLTDERGHRYEMNYDTAGNLNSILAPQVTNPDTGEVTQAGASNIINATGRIESTTDMRGHTTAYTYYPAGHEWAGWKQTESSPVTGAITYTYDTNGNVKSEIRERTVDGVVTTETTLHDYDERNRLTKTTYPDGSHIETVYDLAGNVDLERDRFGNWTDYDYDPYGRLTLTTYPDTTSEQREYTREGLLERIIDRSGHTTRYEYDDAGRLWRTHYEEAGSYTETRYTEQGWVSQAWDENRNLTEYEYDRAGRRTAVIRYLDDVTTQRHEFSYYRNGELHTETDANQRTTTYVLNELDQRIRTEYPNTTTSEQRFDAMGARIGMIDQNAIATSYGYDPQGRLERVTPEVTIDGTLVPDTGYSYDEQGNKLSQTDANGRTTTWTYDSFGRVIRRTLPEGMHETFVYDDSARTQTHTDFNGDITLTRYDAMGRISSIDYQKDGTRIDYTYWPNDQVRTVTDPQGTTEYSYDNRDRLAYRINPDGSRIDYAYDNVGNRTRVSVSDANGATLSQTDYGYDALDRLHTVTDASGTTQYTYDNVSNLDTVTYPNGMVTDYDYNSVSQLTHVTTRDASGTLIGSYSYTLDDTGRRETITEASGRITDYAYDDLYRLTGETISDSVNGDYSAVYQYDWVGNRTGSTIDGVQTVYTYDRNDRLTQQGGTSYTYDNNGNTLTETLDSTTTTYSYNARNELVSVVQGGNTTEYGYNPNGIRSSKRENGVTTRYIVDENRDYAQVLIEDDGTVQVSYTYGDDLISQDRSGEIHYYHYDGLGSTRSLTDSLGNLANTYDYEAFGGVLSQTGTIENRYLFAGEQFDSALDQYYLRARYYDPSQGRFTQQDTWMGRNHDPITLHKYLYAHADPGNLIDPTGNFSMGSMMSAINVMGTLSTIATTTYDVFQIATGEEELTAKKLGSAILFNMMGARAGKVLGLFNKRFADIFRATCSRNSFSAETLVHTEDGLKPIEDISIGDLVWATDPETDERDLKAVTHLIQGDREYELFEVAFENGEVVTATADHPFFSEGQWVNTQSLKVGNSVLVLGNANPIIIRSINKEVREEKVFNLTVDGLHTFHIGEAGYLVHNTNIFCSPRITAVFPKVHIRGLIRNRNLSELSGNQIANAFAQTGYKLSDHAIQRIKDPRHKPYGVNTLADVARIINRGEKVADRDDVAFLLNGMKVIVIPKTMKIRTIRPI